VFCRREGVLLEEEERVDDFECPPCLRLDLALGDSGSVPETREKESGGEAEASFDDIDLPLWDSWELV